MSSAHTGPRICAYCACNFMPTQISPAEGLKKLCNGCEYKELLKTNPKGSKMETVDILIKCPLDVHARIEEACINTGKDYSNFFLHIYHEYVSNHTAKSCEVEHTQEATTKAKNYKKS